MHCMCVRRFNVPVVVKEKKREREKERRTTEEWKSFEGLGRNRALLRMH